MTDTNEIKFLHINLNKSQIATESALQYAVEHKVDLIAIQEPWLIPADPGSEGYSKTRSVAHSAYIQILPNFDPQYRPRNLIYLSRELESQVQLTNDSPNDPDFQFLEIVKNNLRSTFLIFTIKKTKLITQGEQLIGSYIKEKSHLELSLSVILTYIIRCGTLNQILHPHQNDLSNGWR